MQPINSLLEDLGLVIESTNYLRIPCALKANPKSCPQNVSIIDIQTSDTPFHQYQYEKSIRG